MKELTVKITKNYGVEAIYPTDETGRTFAALAGTKTLTRQSIELIKNLGYQINVLQESVTL